MLTYILYNLKEGIMKNIPVKLIELFVVLEKMAFKISSFLSLDAEQALLCNFEEL